MREPRVRNKRNGMPRDAIYIGRGSKWGNPFRIGVHGNRDEVIIKYFEYLKTHPVLIESLNEIKGCDLVCYCHPSLCHGDILLLLANASEEERIDMLSIDISELFGIHG